MISQLEIRHPHVNEVPDDLMVGFECFKMDPEFQWVLIVDGKVKAQMMCANMAGILFIIRLVSHADAPHGWAVQFFRHVMREAKANGMIGYATFLSDKTEGERKLMKIVQRVGGLLCPVSGVWAFGSTEVNY